jgi:hypothetical protein
MIRFEFSRFCKVFLTQILAQQTPITLPYFTLYPTPLSIVNLIYYQRPHSSLIRLVSVSSLDLPAHSRQPIP